VLTNELKFGKKFEDYKGKTGMYWIK
ncbi:MAG: hypothetical protein UW72_C0008G0001, partial [Parcubacteria group bacterium GW2011_GWF2_44_7]